MSLKQTILKIINIISVAIIGGFLLIVIALALRIFIWDTFPVNSNSMYPTIQPGDRILVNKTIFGARIYRNFDFLEGGKLKTFRIKGFRGIKYNDIVLFNNTITDRWLQHTDFAVNGVFVKRVLGLPGDTISIVDGFYMNSTVKDRDTLGVYHIQERDRDILLDIPTHACYPYDSIISSNIKNFVPLYIPRKNDEIILDRDNFVLYRRYIEYETGTDPQFVDGNVILAGRKIDKYKFRDNYYFMGGDNIVDSRDSRYFGLVPEEFIIGVSRRIIYNRIPESGKINFSRFNKKYED